MELVKRVLNTENHLGIETGPMDNEMMSLSGNHKDIEDGQFNVSYYNQSTAAN